MSSRNVYVTGGTQGGLDGNTNAGHEDIFLVKYASAGNKQWTPQVGTSLDDNGNGGAVESSGAVWNVYVTGDTSIGVEGNTSAGGHDVFLVKYNSAGIKQ